MAWRRAPGAYLNLVAPLVFWAPLRATVGPLPALASLVVLSYLPVGQGWNTPTYAPWLYPVAAGS
jgi:hypothetical protein